MPTNYSYSTYLNSLINRYSGDSESGVQDTAISEREWNRLSPEQRAQLVSQTRPDFDYFGNGGQYINAGDDVIDRWRSANEAGGTVGNIRPDDNRFYMTAEEPTGNMRGAAWRDPETGMWVVPHEYLDPEFAQGFQDRQDQSGLFRYSPLGNIALGAGAVLGGAALHGALGAGAAGVEAGSMAMPDLAAAANPAMSAAPEIGGSLGGALGGGGGGAASVAVPGAMEMPALAGAANPAMSSAPAIGGSLGGASLSIPGDMPMPDLTSAANPTLSDAPSMGGFNWQDAIRRYGPGAIQAIIDSQQPNFEDLGRQDREYNQRMWAEQLRASRPNQSTPFGSSEWNQDENGNWTQTSRLNEQDQGRLDQFRGIAAQRMTAAGQAPQIDWDALGLGHLRASTPPNIYPGTGGR